MSPHSKTALSPRLFPTLLGCLSVALCAASLSAQFLTPQPLDDLNQRNLPAIWFDVDRQEPVLFGGRMRTAQFGQWYDSGGLWAFRNGRFRMLPGDLPSKSTTIAYDPLRKRVVQFDDGHTFEWDGLRSHDLGTTPALVGRRSPALTFDPARGEVMLFGGYDQNGVTAFSDTWHWNGGSWRTTSSPVSPSPRQAGGLAADTTRGQVVLFGGFDNGGQLSDTWIWNGTTWAATTPAISPPPAPWQLSMAHDPIRGRTMLLGNGAWEWDGSQWIQIVAPPFRASNLVFDASRGRVIAYATNSGIGGSEAGLWSWDGSRWRGEWLRTAPRDRGALLTDSLRGDLIIVDSPSLTNTVDVHVGGSSGWGLLSVSSALAARSGFAAAFDPVGDRVVLFGGIDLATNTLFGDTWLFDRASRSWQLASRSGPSPRQGAAMAWDPISASVILFGGGNGGERSETWRWNGSSWSQLQPLTTPPPRAFAPTGLDGVSGRLVMAGGYQAPSDLWEWTGSDWSPLSVPSTSYRVTGLGGDPNLGITAWLTEQEMFLWDGGGWSQVPPWSGPQWLGPVRAAFEPATGVLLFQGHEVTSSLWTLAVAESRAWSLGRGCPGALGEPRLLATQLPRVGSTDFALRLVDAAPRSLALLLLSNQIVGGTGAPCTPQVPLNAVVATSLLSIDASGGAQKPLPIPAMSSLVGYIISSQALVLDPQGGFGGVLSASNGLALVLGR